jgi:serine/threonine protein kinase
MAEAAARLTAALTGRYRIERELGEGGMATVYLAEDLKHDRRVAIKVLKPELAATLGTERFLTEIRTTANLQHPHILPLFDSGQADGFLFFVSPYVEGETLRARLDREKQLPVEEAVRIARAVASALQAAHEQGVVHRDIKPANILLSRGEPLVADFGIVLWGEFAARKLAAPVVGAGSDVQLFATLKPIPRLVLEPTFEYSTLHRKTGEKLFSGWIFRSRNSLQFSRNLFLRIIVQYDDFAREMDVEPLLTYRINPFTLFYVGSSLGYHDYRPLLLASPAEAGLRPDSRQLFAKFQYLLRF